MRNLKTCNFDILQDLSLPEHCVMRWWTHNRSSSNNLNSTRNILIRGEETKLALRQLKSDGSEMISINWTSDDGQVCVWCGDENQWHGDGYQARKWINAPQQSLCLEMNNVVVTRGHDTNPALLCWLITWQHCSDQTHCICCHWSRWSWSSNHCSSLVMFVSTENCESTFYLHRLLQTTRSELLMFNKPIGHQDGWLSANQKHLIRLIIQYRDVCEWMNVTDIWQQLENIWFLSTILQDFVWNPAQVFDVQ